MEENYKRRYVYSQSKVQIFLANNLEKFLFILVLIMIVTFWVYKETLNFGGLVLTLCFFGGFLFFFVRIQSLFAYKIAMDFNSKKLRLHMYRSNEIIERDFGSVLGITVNGYIKFEFKDRVVYYNDLKNTELFESINKISKVKWGGMCAIWGPNKAFRDRLGGE